PRPPYLPVRPPPSLMPAPRIDIVIVNWNGGQSVIRCLEAVGTQLGVDVAVTCIDNGSTDGSADALIRRFPAVNLIRLSSNIGFAAAVNRGVHATGAGWLM